MKKNIKIIMLFIITLILISFLVPTFAKYVFNKSIEKTLSVPEMIFYSNTEESYNYTGDYKTYIAPEEGDYFIELWGASGGGDSSGKGAYTSGYIHLAKGDRLYFYVGSQGKVAEDSNPGIGGYNGGGNGGQGYSTYRGGTGGGGATDVRLTKGEWNNDSSLKSRLMVAAGGGGGYAWNSGGAAGGLSGYNNGKGNLSVATQTFEHLGVGQEGISKTTFATGGAEGNCGGGGGYYGGEASNKTGEQSDSGGGGGSSFISGHNGCITIDKKFFNTTMIDGQGYIWTDSKRDYIGVPNATGSETTAGNEGDGFAKISLKESYDSSTKEFSYQGNSQNYTVPATGYYTIELWGASGGGTNSGNGAYTSGEILLTKGETLYFYVGAKGTAGDYNGVIGTGGYNGGANGGKAYFSGGYNYTSGSGGGGATDVRLTNGTWDDSTGLRSRIMVAAGGGGGYRWGSGGAAGGLLGYNNSKNNLTVATQTSSSFGIGEEGASKPNLVSGGAEGNCGGGGGYYGGGASKDIGDASDAGGGGGSSFISGHDGCDAIDKDGNHTAKSMHYSNKVFINTIMIDGRGYKWTTVLGEKVGMPNTTGSGTSDGNNGNGYAKIAIIN